MYSIIIVLLCTLVFTFCTHTKQKGKIVNKIRLAVPIFMDIGHVVQLASQNIQNEG